MEQRSLGATEFKVTPLGFGSAQLGYLGVPQKECGQILNGLLDAGINVIDTAASYADAEEKVGRAVSSRREEYVLVSKCGQAMEGLTAPAWSGQIVRQSAERSLERLKTDHLDVLLLHSCPRADLAKEDLIAGLQAVKRAGLTRAIGYSGDGEDAAYALSLGVFDCFETSISICDQQVLETNLPRARAAGLGVFAKRTLANAAWRDLGPAAAFYNEYREPYVKRLVQMQITPETLGFDGDWLELALRFTVWQPGLSCALIGGTKLDHILENIKVVEKGPLPPAVEQALRDAWRRHDDGSWVGQI